MNKMSSVRKRLAVSALAVVASVAGINATYGQTLWFENFETVELGPNVDEGLTGEQVWGKTFEGWVSDDSGVPGVGTDLDGVTEWAGWSFADKDWWNSTAGDQRRSEFNRASGTVLIADPDEWDDQAHADSEANGWYQTFITSPAFDISGSAANSLFIGFDSSWRPEFDSNYRQSGRVWVQYGDADPTEITTWTSENGSDTYKDDTSTNEYVLLPISNPGNASEAKVIFEMFDAGNDWWWTIDNVAVGVPPLIGGLDVSPVGFTAKIVEGDGKTVNLNSVKLTLDGTEVSVSNSAKEPIEDTVGVDPTDFGPLLDQVNVTYALPSGEWFQPGSQHELVIEFQSSNGETTTSTLPFTAPTFMLVPSAMKIDGAISGNGFTGNIFQGADSHGNTILGAERFLDGLELSCATGGGAENLATETGSFEIAAINLDQDAGSAGGFADDVAIPGIPGSTDSTDNIAAEFVTFVNLDRGVHRFGVNSDDGFKVSVGSNPRDTFAMVLASNGGVSDTSFDFAIEEAGTYAFRLLWFEGGGGAHVEFYTENLTTGERALLSGASQGPEPAYIDWVQPAPGAGAAPDSPVGFKVVAGDDTIDSGSASLTVDGIEVSDAEVTEAGGDVTVLWTPSSLLLSGASHTATLSYSVGGNVRNVSWDFSVAEYFTIPAAAGTATGTGEAPGMLWRTHQLASSRGNSIVLAEQQLAGDLGDNVYDDFGFDSEGFIDVPFVNFEQSEGNAGNFRNDAVDDALAIPDELIPGIPGTTSSTDNIAAEAFAYLQFDTPGIKTMVVNSDDGFQVSVGNRANPNWAVLGQFDGGRGASDTVFIFNVEEAGVYPFRLLWFEGGGGANVEWFTVSPEGCRALVGDDQADGAVLSFQGISVAGADLGAIDPNPVVLPPGALTEPTIVDFGEVSGDATYAFRFNAVKAGASTAIAGNDAWGLKLDQWNEQGVFGVTEFGVADIIFTEDGPGSTASVFDQDVHVAFVNDVSNGRVRLYVDGLYAGFAETNFELAGEGKVMAARIEQNTDPMGDGSVMYSWNVYPAALSDDAIAGLVEGIEPAISGAITGISLDGSTVSIEFTGTLESADSVDGPYSAVAGATSPFTVDASTADAKFYIAR